MKGYKGFDKGLVCRGKQYRENAVFNERKAELCECGIHFCKNPWDVLDYYPLVNIMGEFSEYAEVEAIADDIKSDGTKYCSKKIEIKNKISFSNFVELLVETLPNYIGRGTVLPCGYNAQISSNGEYTRIFSNRAEARIASSGGGTRIGSSGDGARISSSGVGTQIASCGFHAEICSSGDGTQISSSGDEAQITSSSFFAKIGSSGRNARIVSSGLCSRICSSGEKARIVSNGNETRVTSTNEKAVITCIGKDSCVSAKKGSWITLAEYNMLGDPICVKTEFVDGEKIKADTYYTLKGGEFVEYER